MKRTSHVIIREVTSQLPSMPDRPVAERDGETITEPHPYTRGRWFYVELHLANFGWFGPVGLATIDISGSGGVADVASMFVLDGLRREGYGRELIEAAGERWPFLTWTDCDSSRGFHERLVEQGIARKHGSYYQFIPKSERGTHGS